MTLITVPLVVTNLQTGAPLPGAAVTVYKTGTTTKASIFDMTGTPLSNPMIADSTGLVQFQCTAGAVYDMVWSSGSYTSPRYAVGVEVAGVRNLVNATLAAASTSVLTIGSGTQTLIVAPNLAYFPGQRLAIVADASNWMAGVVVSYSNTTLVVSVDTIAGSGTFANWTVGIAGVRGPSNSLTIGSVTTLSPGATATAAIGGASPNQTLSLGIPTGATGSPWSYLPAAAGSVKAANASALPAFTYSAGVMTANANGAFPSIDGQALVVGDRFFHWDHTQGNGSNIAYGIYILTNEGSGSTQWVATRATDANTAGLLGLISAYVRSGTANAGLTLAVTQASGAITLGTTAIIVTVAAGDGTGLAAAKASALTSQWIGRNSAVLDPFFRSTSLSGPYLGRSRFWRNVGTFDISTVFALTNNSAYDGKQLDCTCDGSTGALSGPAIWLDEAGVSVGDSLTVFVEVRVTGPGVAYFPWRFATALTAGLVGSQISGVSVVTGGSSVPSSEGRTFMKATLTVPSGAVVLASYPYVSASGTTLSILSMWAVKGAAAPNGPPIQEPIAPRLDADEAAISALQTAVAGIAPYAGLGRLRNTHAKIDALRRGATARLVLGFAGDSWSTSSSYYLQNLASRLIADLGDGGVGFFGLGFAGTMGSPDICRDGRSLYFATLSGSGWTSNYHSGSTSPNISDARSSTAGDVYTIGNVTGATHPALSDVKLHFTGTSDGVIKWRWNGGSWSSNTNVQGTLGLQQTLSLSGFPTSALSGAAGNSIELEIYVVSGSVVLCGVDFQSSSSGVVIHKLGSSGSAASQWATAAGLATWQAGIAALGLDFFSLLLGTNDQAYGVGASTFQSQLQTAIGGAKTAIPYLDTMIIVPPENNGGYSILMSSLAVGAQAAAVAAKSAFLNLQPAFGDATAPTEYQAGTGLGLLLNASPHPTSTGAVNGANIISNELVNTLLRR